MRTHMGVVTGIFLFAATIAVSADTKIEFKATENGGSSMSSILIGQGKIRSDTSTGMVLIDPTEGSMTIVANDKKEYTKITYGLTAPPEGYHSCHGVRARMLRPSQFADDEFVIYDPSQQRLEYLVEFMA